jgi:hypothetical protein
MSCPLKMSDGRVFTNYEPRCIRNMQLSDMLNKNNLVNSSYEQRLYLQNNYEKIVQEERQRVLNQLSPCVPCNKGEFIYDLNPELDNKYMVYCDNVSCYNKINNEKGLGTSKLF